jgi:uncharacterized protein (DUF1330 family)
MYVHPTPEQFEALSTIDPDQPIVMLNLLRFVERANQGFGCDDMSGREAYEEYGRRLMAMGERFPAKPFWAGEAQATVIGPTDESWDEVILVHYDNVGAFLTMVSDPEDLAAAKARDAAVADSRLVLTHQTRSA